VYAAIGLADITYFLSAGVSCSVPVWWLIVLSSSPEHVAAAFPCLVRGWSRQIFSWFARVADWNGALLPQEIAATIAQMLGPAYESCAERSRNCLVARPLSVCDTLAGADRATRRARLFTQAKKYQGVDNERKIVISVQGRRLWSAWKAVLNLPCRRRG